MYLILQSIYIYICIYIGTYVPVQECFFGEKKRLNLPYLDHSSSFSLYIRLGFENFSTFLL
jgi:hypothetical protein